jgi:hypothetical protein
VKINKLPFKNKFNIKSSHPGFIFTLPLMLGIGLIIFAALIAISQGFVAVGGPLVPQLITDMPTFYDYDKTTGDIILDPETGNPKTNERVDLYWLLVQMAIFVLSLIGILAIASYFFEGIKIIKRGTAISIIGKILVFLPLFLVFPFAWDVYAILIENFSLFLLDPFDLGISPADRTAKLWSNMGSIVPPGALDLNAWSKALSDPGAFGQGLLKDVFLGLFKGFAVMFMTAMMFIISTIRVLLTIVIAMSIPLILTLGLVPLFRKVKDMMVNNLVGLSIAPIFSALVLTTGIAYLDSTELPAMQDWFASLAVGFLAVFFPVMLAPILGQITTQVGQMITTAITAGSIVGAVAGQGALSGIQNASNQMSGAAMNMASTGLASSAGSSIENKINQPISSLELGKLSSGASSMDIPQMSFGDKFRTYAKAGLAGAGAGLTAGGIQAATNAMHIPQVGKPIARDILHSGDLKAIEIGQTGVVNHNLSFIDSHMKSLEPVNYVPVIEKAVIPETGQVASIVMNPGVMVNEMDYVSNGHNIINDSSLQQEYLNMQHNQIKGFDRFNPGVQAKADIKLLEQLHEHPGSAGKMFESMKSIEGKQFEKISSSHKLS